MRTLVAIAGLMLVAGGCTVHPDGEQHERQVAEGEGARYLKPYGERTLPTLPQSPSTEQLVQYALLASPDLERRYWEWRSAIEQVAQDGTQPTNVTLSAGVPIANGSTALSRTILTLANDPMNDIEWPSKLSTAARRALEVARAAGLRFRQAKYDLRQRVLDACDDYAVATELVRLERADADLLRSATMVADAGLAAGKSSQSAALVARDEADLSENRVAEVRASLPGLRAAVNAALGRDPAAPLPPLAPLPSRRQVRYTDEQVLHLAALHNPELAALDAEVRGKGQGVRLAELQYVPDFSLSADTDLGGVAQSLVGMVTVPVLRYEAINAAIAQAEANLRSTAAMRRQSGYDVRRRVIADLASFRDAERQVRLLDDAVLPRAAQAVEVTRSEYEAGRDSLLEFLDAERTFVSLQRLALEMRATRERQLADLEAAAATRFDTGQIR